ncbi:DUF2911 domain-containing protein [Acidiluteibacter ferrifornacis]|uniref:DUF2911 domain-containing protein n=1 Tax=Acidiluteibacter ferrifornacis TaxID=2692424 RepID=A0A6N9NN35_9FLAO|nr:DUF2911 domain-containing protein [Acidiluteibacter ferrifornacis]NBG67302.1 DUF2911 domain-containing protein [Acidiluteibacter ferrifornacis]
MLKKIILILLLIGLLLFGGFQYMIYQTKKASPEQVETYTKDDATLSVFYSSPAARGRKVMDSLVPFGKIWRTGANEATTFITNKAIEIEGTELAAGTYTLWTIPNKTSWEIIFNSKSYDWGLNWDGTSPREPEFDVLRITVPVEQLDQFQERFQIHFEENLYLTLSWEKTKVKIPIVL